MIGELVRKIQDDYINGETTISKYVSFSQYENIEKIDAYVNSKHISGDTDSLGREKPFFNIVTGAVNIWYRATDIDRKNIRIKATKVSDEVGAFLATVHLQRWMKKSSFGVFLNRWGKALATYGSAVSKFVEKGGELEAEVVSWNRLLSDTVDFENNPKVEILYLTKSQLLNNKSYYQDSVKQLLDALESRETIDGQKKDNRNDFIKVYEVHGELPLSYITEKDSDKDIYVQQMHAISFLKTKDKDKYDDFTLYKGREAKDPYFITHLIKEDGRSQSIGAVEHLFMAQWMVNHTSKNIKDQLDLASKVIFQTSDGDFVGVNALKNIEQGEILIYKENNPITQINNSSHDISSLQNFGEQWQVLAKEITSTPDSISGKTMPSGTAYRQVAILNQEANSLFELMTENKGLAIEGMFRKYVIPFLLKKMNTVEEISATLDDNDIKQIDTMYIDAEVTRRNNDHVKDSMLKDNSLGGQVAQPFDMESEKAKIQAELSSTGNQRFFKPADISTKTWKEVFDGLLWDLEVEVTNEQSDKQAIIATLSNVLQTIASNPAILDNPNLKMLFNKILSTTGVISPLELSANQFPAQPAQPAQPMKPNAVQPIANGQPSIVGGGALLNNK